MPSHSSRWWSACWPVAGLALAALLFVGGWFMGHAAGMRRLEPADWAACYVLVDGQPLAQSRLKLACAWMDNGDLLVRRVR